MQYTELRGKEICKTLELLRERIATRFPGSGLSRVSDDLSRLALSAEQEIERLRKPVWLARIGAALGIAGIVGITVAIAYVAMSGPVGHGNLYEFLQGIEAAANEVILLVIGIFFMLTLETRVKRKAVLRALYRLRSIIHVVDMHQLTKDPEYVFVAGQPLPAGRKETLTRFQMVRYLDYCSELFALSSKVAALYSQHVNDPVVVAAVNEVESLAANLAQKVWQKIMILDARRETAPEADARAGEGGETPVNAAPDQALISAAREKLD